MHSARVRPQDHLLMIRDSTPRRVSLNGREYVFLRMIRDGCAPGEISAYFHYRKGDLYVLLKNLLRKLNLRRPADARYTPLFLLKAETGGAA